MSVKPYFPPIEFNSPQDIELALKTEGIKTIVEERAARYQQIKVNTAIENMSQVGDLLYLGYAASIGHNCGIFISKIFFKYQRLIGDSSLTSKKFMNASLEALQWHKHALEYAEEKDFNTSLEALSKCAEAANELAGASEELVNFSNDLCTEAENAFTATQNDQNTNNEEKNKIKRAWKETAEKEAALKSKRDDLQKIIKEQEEREIKALAELEKIKKKSFILAIINGVGQGIMAIAATILPPLASKHPGMLLLQTISNSIKQIETDQKNLAKELEDAKVALAGKKVELENAKEKEPLKKEIAELETKIQVKNEALEKKKIDLKAFQTQLQKEEAAVRETAAAAAKKKDELRQQEVIANAELASAVLRLQNCKNEQNDLDKAFTALEIAIKTLGKIKCVFEDTRLFWIGISQHCQALAKIETAKLFAKSTTQTKFILAIKDSGLSWLGLAHINSQVHFALTGIRAGVSKNMSNLPNKAEAEKLIPVLSEKLLKQIQ